MGSGTWGSRPLRAFAVLGVVLALAGSACSGDDDSADESAPEQESLTEQFPFAAEMGAKVFEQTGAEIAEDVQVCLGGELLSTFGTERAEELIELEFQDQPPAEFELIARIFDECVPGGSLAASMVKSITEQFTNSDPGTRVVECVGEQIDGRVGTMLEELVETQRTTEPPQQLMIVLDTCTPPEDLNALLQAIFIEQGSSPPVAACASKKLSDAYSFRDVIEGAIDGATSDIESGAAELINECLTAAAEGGAP